MMLRYVFVHQGEFLKTSWQSSPFYNKMDYSLSRSRVMLKYNWAKSIREMRDENCRHGELQVQLKELVYNENEVQTLYGQCETIYLNSLKPRLTRAMSKDDIRQLRLINSL